MRKIKKIEEKTHHKKLKKRKKNAHGAQLTRAPAKLLALTRALGAPLLPTVPELCPAGTGSRRSRRLQ